MGELSCIAQACMSLSLPICPPALTDLFFDPCEEVSTPSFYHSRSGSYNETQGPTGGPEVVETYTTFRVLMARVANDVLHGVSSVGLSYLITLLY
jgi:hypothetical protein